MDSPNHLRSICPVACTLDLIGDRWTLLVIRDLFAGKTHFKEFSASPENIASNILTSRLNRLVEEGLANRQIGSDSGFPEYHLTDKGRSLMPVLQSIAAWGLEHVTGTAMKVQIQDGKAQP